MGRRQDTTVIATTVRGDTLILEPLWTLEPLWALEACGAGVSKARANPNWLVPFNGSAMFANFLRGLAKTGGGVLEPFHYSSKHPSSPCPEACQPIGSGRPISTTTLAHRAHRGPLLAGPCRGKPICSATGPSTTFGIRIASLVAPDTDADVPRVAVTAALGQ